MINKKLTALSIGLLFAGTSYAQKLQDLPEYKLAQSTTTKHMNILASDEMMGRKPG
jgi:hypothetical protein